MIRAIEAAAVATPQLTFRTHTLTELLGLLLGAPDGTVVFVIELLRHRYELVGAGDVDLVLLVWLLVVVVFHLISSCDLNCVSNRKEEIFKLGENSHCVIVFPFNM